jgi:hypothetical protein
MSKSIFNFTLATCDETITGRDARRGGCEWRWEMRDPVWLFQANE